MISDDMQVGEPLLDGYPITSVSVDLGLEGQVVEVQMCVETDVPASPVEPETPQSWDVGSVSALQFPRIFFKAVVQWLPSSEESLPLSMDGCCFSALFGLCLVVIQINKDFALGSYKIDFHSAVFFLMFFFFLCVPGVEWGIKP